MTLAWFADLLDDAALFPPGELPLPEAVPAHRRHLAAWYASMVGPFVYPASRLGELPAVLDAPLDVSLTVPQGPAALHGALAQLPDAVSLRSVEITLPPDVEVADLLRTLDTQLPAGVTGYVEIPRDHRRVPSITALAGTGYRAKFRTGGLVPAAHPGERELADSIRTAAGCAVPFKCTAGLHHAVRHTDGDLEQHGFLNVLLATDAALRGADVDDIAVLLGERSGADLAELVVDLAPERMADARAEFLSFGTCDLVTPVGDLMFLGLIREGAVLR
ncbi:MAG TPA: hypothetical protein VHF06_19240 [Pseudonocardiaceae bacterium]|nr:hypothetical protein [Pseudonocardiaceae bacterium]